ncbi:hypothetical protein ACN9U3_03120 [Staphylococcus caprae]|uniref:hypothetical protein n=1 Tax=Staphylococcus caprae TaxID=29380 RepID=UPI003B218DF7
MMSAETLEKEITQGMRNEYKVVITLTDGRYCYVKEFLNKYSEENYISVKTNSGMMFINTESVVSVIKFDSDTDTSKIFKG